VTLTQVLVIQPPHATANVKIRFLALILGPSHLTCAEKQSTVTAQTDLGAKVPSGAAFKVYSPLSLDTSRFEHRLILLSRTLLAVPSQWFD
jgi:hypothetical protein